jgi:HAD superfamily hydrolase (TIGR01484 family)
LSIPKLKSLNLLNSSVLSKIDFIGTDMDGTLTTNGKISAAVVDSLIRLEKAGVHVFLVTGRSAGWVSAMVSLFPFAGGIAENGGACFLKGQESPISIGTDGVTLNEIRAKLEACFHLLCKEMPGLLKVTGDNAFRVSDWTFERHGLSLQDLLLLREKTESCGLAFTYSTIHCHIMPAGQNKATGLLETIFRSTGKSLFESAEARERILTIGDSPNDEPLFDQSVFMHSVGVANVQSHLLEMKFLPHFVTNSSEGEGFVEMANLILKNRGDSAT